MAHTPNTQHAHTNTPIHTHTRTHTHKHIHAQRHIHGHIHTHTHTHTAHLFAFFTLLAQLRSLVRSFAHSLALELIKMRFISINLMRWFHPVSTHCAVPPWRGKVKSWITLTSCSPLAHLLALLRSLVRSLAHSLALELMKKRLMSINLTQRFHTVSTHCAVPPWRGTAKGSRDVWPLNLLTLR